jgi:hypothetical protein
MTDLPPYSPPPGPSPLPGAPAFGAPAPGAPPAGSTRRRLGRPLVITAVVAVVVGAGTGAAVAVTGSSSPSPSASSPAPAAPPGHAGRPGFGGRFFGAGPRAGAFGPFGAFGAVHGQFVVPKQGGGYQTVDTQRGQVTAVSNSAITIKSADGFVKTYMVTGSTIVDAQRDGIGSVKVGDQAAVSATVSGSTATAAAIADLSNLRGLRQRFFHGNPPAAPAPG